MGNLNTITDRLVDWIVDRPSIILRKERNPISNYLITILLIIIVLMARLSVAPLNEGKQYVTFIPVVALAAAIGGIWTGLFAAIISMGVATFIFTPPYYSFSIQALENSFWPNLVFFFDAFIVCAVIEGMHRYRASYKNELVEVRRQADKAETLLKRNQILMKNSLDGIHILDVEGNVIEATDAFCNRLGYTQKEITGQNVINWDAKFSKEELRDVLKNCIGNSAKFETVHRRKDGVLIDVEISASGVEVDGQQLIFVSSRDITERKLAEANLRATEKMRTDVLEQKFGHLLQNSFNEIYLIDASSYAFLRTSAGAQKNLGYSASELEHLTLFNIRPGYTAEEFNVRVAPLLEGKVQTLLFNTFHIRKNGTTYPVEVRLQYMDGVSPVFLAIAQDISERLVAEQNEKRLTRALRLLSEFGTLMIYADTEQDLLDATCRLAVEIGGYEMACVGFPENDSNKTVRLVAVSNEQDEYLKNLNISWSDSERGQGPTGTAIRTGNSVVNTNFLTNPKMTPWREAAIKRGFKWSIALPLKYYDNVLGALTIYSASPEAFGDEEVSLLEKLANNLSFGIEALRTRVARSYAEKEARELSLHIQNIREEEKAHLAREIHDDLGGTLAALKMDAYWLKENLTKSGDIQPLRDCAKSMVDQLNMTIVTTRHLMTELRPSILDDLGLMEAVRWKALDFQNRTGIKCRLSYNGDECKDELDANQSINLFRIVQESLTNIAKHSGASKVDVGLNCDDNEIILSICDDGCGLPEEGIVSPNSFGLRGMRERVELLDGKIKFEKPVDGGLCVTVKLPKSLGRKIL